MLMFSELAKARHYFERALSSETDLPRSLTALFLTHLATCLQILGYLDQALRTMGQAEQKFAEGGMEPWRLAGGHLNATLFYAQLGDGGSSLRHLDAAESLAEKYGFAELASSVRSWRALALALVGRHEEARALVRACVGSHPSISLRQRAGGILALGRACAEAGLLEEGLGLVEALQSIAQGPGTDVWASMADWLKGRLLQRCDPPDFKAAEDCLRRAIAGFRAMGNRFYELRCATDLAGVLRDTGRRDEARATLADIYGWFTEGFDTHYLKEAKALLDELTI